MTLDEIDAERDDGAAPIDMLEALFQRAWLAA